MQNGQTAYDDKQKITTVAAQWQNEIKILASDQIRIGVDNLHCRKNAEYPPSALEFVSHCREMGAEDCADQIFDYLDQPCDSDFWWQTDVAFNVYKKLHYNPKNNINQSVILARIKSIYRKLDLNNLDPLPPKPIKIAMAIPKKSDRDRGRFQGLMFFCIMRSRPDLLGIQQDPMAVGLFKAGTTVKLMKEYQKQGKPKMADFLRSQQIYV